MSKRFASCPIIYGDEPLLSITWEWIGSVGFTLEGYPKEHHELLLGSLNKQIGRLLDKAYKRGRDNVQDELRRALGLREQA